MRGPGRCPPQWKRSHNEPIGHPIDGGADGDRRRAQIAAELVAQHQPTRARLIDKGLIYSPSYGLNEFMVPQFDAVHPAQLPARRAMTGARSPLANRSLEPLFVCPDSIRRACPMPWFALAAEAAQFNIHRSRGRS
jgi:hypothetical protein